MVGLLDAVPALVAGAGKLFDYFTGRNEAAENVAHQREFAQNSIQWKVADAAKAGVNPLAALGVPSMSFTPTTSSSDFSGMGQDISRAITAVSGPGQRASAMATKLAELGLEKASLENDYIRSQIRRNIAETGPSSPIDLVPGVVNQSIPGQGDGLVSGVRSAAPTQPIWMSGARLAPPPGWSAAQDVQNQWGEMGEWLYGPAIIGATANKAYQDTVKGWDLEGKINRAIAELFGISRAY